MITSHVWRPLKQRAARSAPLPYPDSCAYMNCRRPRAAHQKAVTSGRWGS